MKICSLSRFVLASTMFASSTASAVPGLWQQGYGQGNMEYSVTGANGKMLTISYTGSSDRNGIYQHSVFLVLAGDKTVSSYGDGTGTIAVMDHKQYAIPSTFGWRNGDNAWFSFIMDIRKARQFDVYVSDQKVGSFNPDVQNTQKALSVLADCTND